MIKLVREIKKVKNQININKFELIFVDDDSTDKTHKIYITLKVKIILLISLSEEKTRDLSQSCFVGFNKSRYRNILVMDGDLQHPPRYIKIIKSIFL